MKIKFKDEEGYCLTPCPFEVMNGYTGEPKKVGSNECADCLYCSEIDTEKNVVDCICGKEELKALKREKQKKERQGMKNYRIICYWPSEVWAVQERVEKDDHTTDWMEVHRCTDKRWEGYYEAKNWIKDNDK